MKVIEIEPEAGRRWLEQWLGAGHFVSEAVLSSASFDHGQFRTCISDEAAAKLLPDFETGWVTSGNEVDVWLAEVLDGLTDRGGKCVVVEDDLSNPTDSGLANDPTPTAFIHKRVFSWDDLKLGNGAELAKEVMRVGSGYPRNAFVTTRSAAELGFTRLKQASEKFPQQVAESLLAVIVSIFDDESYLIWTPPD